MTDQLRAFVLVANLSVVSVVLCVFRHSSTTYYDFLLWNLFLAWLPYVCSSAVTISFGIIKTWMKVLIAAPLAVAWVLLFPNAHYIVTDLLHLTVRKNTYYVHGWFIEAYWFDFFMVLLFAWTGILLGYLSLLQMHALIRRFVSNAWTWLLVCGFCFLSGFGIFLGREIRLNSWDILSRPRVLGHAVIEALHGTALKLSFLFGMIVLITYLTFYFLPSPRK